VKIKFEQDVKICRVFDEKNVKKSTKLDVNVIVAATRPLSKLRQE